MTAYGERQARGKILCEKLAGQVATITPAGIELWDRAWEIVDGSSATFMIALSAWEIDPSDLTLERVTAAYDAVLDAWREAAAEFTAERTP